jgi:hypothetical protein
VIRLAVAVERHADQQIQYLRSTRSDSTVTVASPANQKRGIAAMIVAADLPCRFQDVTAAATAVGVPRIVCLQWGKTDLICLCRTPLIGQIIVAIAAVVATLAQRMILRKIQSWMNEENLILAVVGNRPLLQNRTHRSCVLI